MGTKNRTGEVVYWSCSDNEELEYDNMDEAIESYLEDFLDSGMPDTVMVSGYVRVDVSSWLSPNRILGQVLSALDEEFGSPYTDGTEPTDKMIKAAKEFCRSIEGDYVSWQCEPVEVVNIDPLTWIEENRPDWLGKR